MPLTTLDTDELLDLIHAIIRTVEPDADISTFSDWDIDARILAELFEGNQHQAEHLARQIFVRTCDDEKLSDHARDLGTTFIPAQKSVGKVAVVTSSAGTTINQGERLTAPDGTAFVVSADATSSTSAVSAKSASEGSDGSRLIVAPDTSGISVGDLFECDLGYGGAGAYFGVRGLLTGVPGIELFRDVRVDPADFAGGISMSNVTGAVVDIIADEAGAGGNQVPWTGLSWEGTPTGVVAGDVTLLECGGGGDEESYDELRARLIAMRTGANSGALEAFEAAWIRWVSQTPGVRVGRVFVFPNLSMLGVQTIVCEGVSGARELPSSVLDDIEAYLEEVSPPGEVLDVRTRSLGSPTTVDVTVTPAVGSEPDWGPTIAAPSLAGSYTTDTGSTTTRVQLTADATGNIGVGDRITIYSPDISQSLVREVSAVSAGGGSPYVDITVALPAAPVSGETVLPGGPLSQPIIDAVIALFDDLGPGAETSGVVARRYPGASAQGPYELSLARIYDTILGVDDVENVSIASPGADVTPAALATVKLDELLVRYEAV